MKLENYKVRVSNAVENEEAQNLLFQLGYEWNIEGKNFIYPSLKVLFAKDNGKIYMYSDNHSVYNEITLQQLRNLVANQKTIGKISYLVKTIDKWEEQELTSDTPESETCLKIPDGGFSLTRCEDSFLFWNHDQTMCLNPKIENVFRKYNYGGHSGYFRMNSHTMNKLVEWQHSPETLPTNPEELPFIDDEPKMTNINQTLNERQSQYGSFEDVATVTQDLLAILERTGLKSLPKPHKEALHMICSKMARVVNGDFNHVDSWHDIAGYATLIVEQIKLEQNNG